MKRLKGIHGIAIVAAVFLMPILAAGALQSPYDFEHGTIAYTTSVASDAVAKLQARIDSGETKLQFDPEHGYLPALLNELRIPRTSQSLVFSKTSLQLFLISPETPRAIYFSDDLYVGAVQASPILEIAAMDPKLVSELASRGGKAAQRAGTAHRFNSEEARVAGRKGGQATGAKRRAKSPSN